MVVELDAQMREQIKQMFAVLEDEVTVHLFVKDEDCLYCNDTTDLVNKVAEISDKVKVEVHKGPLDSGKAKELGVRFHPGIVLHGKDSYKVRFYGIPAGHEFGTFISSIMNVSTGAVPLPPEIIDDIKAIEKPVHIQVFTTPQCVYCPDMVRISHQAAILNPLIEADMIESLEFQEQSVKYAVFGVPKTIFNEKVTADGLIPPDAFVDKLFEAIAE